VNKRVYLCHLLVLSFPNKMLAYFLYRVPEYLNFYGNVYKTSRRITRLRKQEEQDGEIDRGAVFSSKQTTTQSNKREKIQTVTLSTSVPVMKCQLHDPQWISVQ